MTATANATETQTTTESPAFKVGETYECRSACNYDTIYRWRVTGRTAKTMTLVEVGYGGHEEAPKRVKVRTYDGGWAVRGEWALPDGDCSMCPVIYAERPKA